MHSGSGSTEREGLSTTRQGTVLHLFSPRLGKPVPPLRLWAGFAAVGVVGLLIGFASGDSGIGRLSAEMSQATLIGGAAILALAVAMLAVGIRQQQSSDMSWLLQTPPGEARWALARAIVATSRFGRISRLLGRNAQALLLAAPWDAADEPRPRIITVNLPPQLKPASIAADGTVTPPANRAAPLAGGPLRRMVVQLIFGLPMLAVMLGVAYLLAPSDDRIPPGGRLLLMTVIWLVTMVVINPDVQMFFQRRELRRAASEPQAIERRLEWLQLQAAHASSTSVDQSSKTTAADRLLLVVVPSPQLPMLALADLIPLEHTGRTHPAMRALSGLQVAAAIGAWLKK